MWIFYSYYKDCIELWSRERGLNRTSAAYPPSFYMRLKDLVLWPRLLFEKEYTFRGDINFSFQSAAISRPRTAFLRKGYRT